MVVFWISFPVTFQAFTVWNHFRFLSLSNHSHEAYISHRFTLYFANFLSFHLLRFKISNWFVPIKVFRESFFQLTISLIRLICFVTWSISRSRFYQFQFEKTCFHKVRPYLIWSQKIPHIFTIFFRNGSNFNPPTIL